MSALMPPDLSEAALCVSLADVALDRAGRDPAGPWHRGAPFLLRRGLEAAVDAIMERRGVGDDASMRAKLICLTAVAPAALVADVTWLWSRLSGLCHYNSYRMDPPLDELRRHAAALRVLFRSLEHTMAPDADTGNDTEPL